MAAKRVTLTFKHTHPCKHAGREVTRDVIALSGEVDGIMLHCIDPEFFWAVLECVNVTTSNV